MKRFVVLVIFSLLLFSFFAESINLNNQKLWNVESDLYKQMNSLFLSYGISLPSSSGPWNTDELKIMLTKIDLSKCNAYQKKIYSKIYEELYKNPEHMVEDTLGFSVTTNIHVESYVHTNTTDFNRESDWNIGFTEREPLIVVPFEGWIANHFYGYGEGSLGKSSGIIDDEEGDSQYMNYFNMNIPLVFSNGNNDFDLNFPRRSFISFGGNHWNVSFGRDVIRWGHGETGNLFLGGNQLYDNHIRMTTFYDHFKFSCVSIFYPHPQVVLYEDYSSQNANVNGLKMFFTHRYEGRFFNDKLSVTAQESLMYQSADNTLDVRVFNPLGIFHNYYIRGNANSMLGFDVDYAIMPGLNTYGQIVIDEFSLAEPDETSSSGWRPSKFGYLLGLKYLYPTENGVFTSSLEGVLTDPYLYLREKYNTDGTDSYTDGVSFYGELREFNISGGLTYLRECVGYKYGGDAVVANWNFGYESNSNWLAKIDLFYMAHGIVYNELISDWLDGGTITPKTPTTVDPTGSNESGEVEHLFRASMIGSYQILPWFYTDAQIDNWFILNKENEQNPVVYDLQIYLGFHMTF